MVAGRSSLYGLRHSVSAGATFGQSFRLQS